MSQHVPPSFYSVLSSLCFLDLGDYFLYMLGKFSTKISSNIFSHIFFLFFFWDICSCFSSLPQRFLKLSTLLLIHFFFFNLFCESDFYHSNFQLTYPFCY